MFAIVVVLPASAYAWGQMGHAVIAYIAESRMAPEVHARVMHLLATDRSGLADPADIGDQASWADRYRDAYGRGEMYQTTRRWHFVDFDRRNPDVMVACYGRHPRPEQVPASEGPARACIIDKLAEFIMVLGDHAASETERLRALQFVLHLTGDIHQPMHAISDDDLGGNDKRVSVGRGPIESLHHAWDTTFVERLAAGDDEPLRTVRDDWRTAARALADKLGEDDTVVSDGGGPEDWARESFRVAKADAYARLGKPDERGVYRLGRRYVERAERVVEQQLSRAGVRLAAILNKAFATDELRSEVSPANVRADVVANVAIDVATNVAMNAPITADATR